MSRVISDCYGHWPILVDFIAWAKERSAQHEMPIVHELPDLVVEDYGLQFYNSTFLFVH